MKRLGLAAAFLLIAAGGAAAQRAEPAAAADAITAASIRARLEFLSHDLLEGRAPGTRGGQLAALYIADQFSRAGLQPVNGSYFQAVPLRGTTVVPGRVSLGFHVNGRDVPARYAHDVVLRTSGPDTLVSVDAQLVFVGYGVRAPEFAWDDFKGADLTGKVLVFLANEPPAPPEDATRFDGRALTYYGRWTYKLEEAARRGAAGALIVHTTAAAGYPWDVVRSSWTGEQLALADDDAPTIAIGGWITDDLARRLFAAAGLSLDALAARAAQRDFRPVYTPVRLRARIASRVRRLETANVVGVVPGRHAMLRDEVLVYTAHYDHLGIGPAVDGDSIYNGAYDNAGGVAALIDIAGAFARLTPRPARSVLFIATAAEEAGLLGAEHYVRHPLFPLADTRASINIDGANLWGETDDVAAVGADRSTLGRIVERHARSLGMRVRPDHSPGAGLFFRADHFPFARAGVPALSIHHGVDFRGRPPGWGIETLEHYTTHHYHRPSDHFDPAFDLGGAVQQARLAFLVGLDIATGAADPEWYHNTAPASQPRR